MLEIYIDPDYFSFEHLVAFVFTKLITIYEHKKLVPKIEEHLSTCSCSKIINSFALRLELIIFR